MRPIFKTGSFLTAKNLNLAQKVSGLTGIVEGCDLFISDVLQIGVSKGLAKLKDGIAIEFDGSDTIDMSSKEDGDYYACVVEYSDYSIALDIFKTKPNYEYLELASIKKEGNSITIKNSAKSSVNYVKKFLNVSYLKEYFKCDTELDVNTGLRYCLMKVVNTESIDLASGEFNLGFIADSPISSIRFRGTIENPNQLSIELFVNGNRIDTESVTYFDISINNGFVINVPYGYINTNDIVTFKITLFNSSSSEALAKMYEITLN